MSNIYAYVEEQKSAFKNGIPLEEGWWWSFKEHIRLSFLYKNSQFDRNNEDRDKRPFKNIIRPVLNVQYRTEGFDVKDIEIYVDNQETYYKSFLVKKLHDKWALTNEMDTFIDELVESFVDYGGVLVKNVKGIRPEVVDLRTIAFCDQSDFLSGPFGIEHYFSPSQLRAMSSSGWGNSEKGATITIEDLILKSESHKDDSQKTPGRYVKIYEIHNVSEMDFHPTSKDSDQMIYIVGLYKDEKGQEQGVCLFKNKEPKLPFKFLKRDPIQGRALGFGGVEELFEPQVWTNFAEIHTAAMLEHASITAYKTTDPRFKGQKLSQSDNGKIFELQPNTDFNQIDNSPRDITAFTNFVVEMHEHAMELGAASDLFLGQQPTAGTPFKSVETQLIEGKSLHLWRQGRIAVFVDEIYRDWVIPHLAKEVTKGSKFLAELSADEMIYVGEALATNGANQAIKDKMLKKGEIVSPEEQIIIKDLKRQNFTKGGTKKFLEILKDEMSGEKLDVRTNIVGKQKNQALFTDKLVNLVRQFIATPEIRQDPEMIKMINSILESSGLSPIVFSPRLAAAQPEGSGGTEGLKALGANAKQNESVARR